MIACFVLFKGYFKINIIIADLINDAQQLFSLSHHFPPTPPFPSTFLFFWLYISLFLSVWHPFRSFSSLAVVYSYYNQNPLTCKYLSCQALSHPHHFPSFLSPSAINVKHLFHLIIFRKEDTSTYINRELISSDIHTCMLPYKHTCLPTILT